MDIQNRPKVGLGVYILNQEGQILLTKRQGSHGAGKWCAPGGHLEFGQSFLECAAMEAKEEVNIDVTSVRFLTATNDIYEGESKHYVTIHCLATGWSGEAKIMEPDKCAEIKWFSTHELPKEMFLSNANFFKEGGLVLLKE